MNSGTFRPGIVNMINTKSWSQYPWFEKKEEILNAVCSEPQRMGMELNISFTNIIKKFKEF